jgi:tRNA1(Val) A37 N6-methylase TrmN6
MKQPNFVEAVKQGGTGLEVLPPLIVHELDGGYTEEMKDIYRIATEK